MGKIIKKLKIIRKNLQKLGKEETTKESETVTLNQLLDFLNISGTSEKELSEVTYFACLKILSESIGKLPFKLLKVEEKTGSHEARDHELYSIMRYRPNPYMNATIFWSTVEIMRNHFGNAYVWRDGVGSDTKLWILPDESVQVYYNKSTALRNLGDIFYVYTAGEKRYILSSDEVFHFRTSMTFDGIVGMPVREILSTTIKGNAKAQTMLNKLYESGFTSKAVVQYAGNLNDDNTQTFIENIENYAKGEVDSSSSIIPIPIGANLQPLNIKLGDNEFVELKKYSALQIASAFGIKPNQLNDYSKSSYASSEAQQLAFYIDTLLYTLKQYEEEVTYKTLSQMEIAKGYKFKFNISVMLRADQKSQMEILTKAVSNFIYTPNEARRQLDLCAKEGGDSLIGNGSVIKAEQIGIQYDSNAKGGGKNE